MSLNMKTQALFLGAVLSLLSFVSFAQKDEGIEPWEQVVSRQPFQQGMDGTLLLEITNTGADMNDCITKAKQAAVYTVLFMGYTEANNIPAAAAISPTGIALYKEKQEYFKAFLTSPSEYGNFVPKAEPNTRKPASKIDKKTIEASIIVTIEVDRLRKAMEDQGIIKSVQLFSFKPRIIICPSKMWMTTNKYVKTIDNQGVAVEMYDFPKACKDPKIYTAMQTIANKIGGPNGAFEVVSIDKTLEDIALQEQINNAATQATKTSTMDIFYSVLKADLWLELDLNTSSPDNGLSTDFTGTLSAVDPYTLGIAIPGKPIKQNTKGSDFQTLTKNVIGGVMNEFSPLILQYFQSIQKNGIKGRITYKISEELEENFETEVTLNDEDIALGEAIAKIQKQTGEFKTAPKIGTATSTLQDYMAEISFEYKDEDLGTMEKNSFYRVGNKIKSKLKKLGYVATVTTPGMGRIEITITGKKEQ
jgi:hypothetical protein